MVVRTIELTQGKKTIVCDCHYDLVASHKWCHSFAGGKSYAVRTVGGKQQAMHRIINSTPSGILTDHKDGDGLNNQCFNLRNATNRQNSQNIKKRIDNTSGYKGVTFSRDNGRVRKWRARIVVSGKEVYLGRFFTKEEANDAYEGAALEYFGEFARLTHGT